MATHFHLCDQCGTQYVCHAPMETTDGGWPAICATKKEADPIYRFCVNCAEEALDRAYASDVYDALRAADEALRTPHNGYSHRVNRRVGRGDA